MAPTDFPKYFEVNFDTLVVVRKDGDEIAGFTHGGIPYSPIKALCEGYELTEEESEKRKRGIRQKELGI